ncbi:MAG: DNA polymerase III subunit epsilon, partial [Thermoanaerobaculia bacterium]
MIDRANDHYALDITRARTLLDWEPKRSLRETLPKMVAALKADPIGWYRENDLDAPPDLEAPSLVSPEHTEHGGHAPSPPRHPAALSPGVGMPSHAAMAPSANEATVAMTHAQGPSWPHFANMILGLWLITTAFALGYASVGLRTSDVASGSLVILFAVLSLSRRPFWRLWAPWANSLVGVWLLFAPLVFWAPAAAYSN